MTNFLYPLGHTQKEIQRLSSQSGLLMDPVLIDLAKKAGNCLEIGAGAGSNWPILQSANPKLQYTGIDNSQKAIETAKREYQHTGAEFQVMDILKMDFCSNSFDLVISKLVLWSIGESWITVIDKIYDLLKPGGIFYAFEPFDKGVHFEPARPHLAKLMSDWDNIAVHNGLDPFIGPKIPLAIHKKGFRQVQTSYFPVIALSSDTEKYSAICNNIRNFYFGDDENNHIQIIDANLTQHALDELDSKNDSLVMDSFFVTHGIK